MTDREKNRFSARARRYARVGTSVGGVAARMADLARARAPSRTAPAMRLALAAALGGLKGPIMKVAQLMATIPDVLPPEYANELIKLQSQAPPMGWAFVKRRMQAELGADWEKKFRSSSTSRRRPPRSARCTARARSTARSWPASCNIPTCSRRSRPTCSQLQIAVRDPQALRPGDRHYRDRQVEIAARLREELDYVREAKHVALYRAMLDGKRADPRAAGLAGAVDRPAAHPRLARAAASCSSTRTTRSTTATGSPARHVHRLVAAVQPLRRHPRRPASRQLYGVRRRQRRAGRHQPARLRLHPHLSRRASSAAWSIFIAACSTATTSWWCTPTRPGASSGSTRELIDALNIWARFIYGPLLDDRVRTHRRRGQAVGIRPQARPSGCTGR